MWDKFKKINDVLIYIHLVTALFSVGLFQAALIVATIMTTVEVGFDLFLIPLYAYSLHFLTTIVITRSYN